MLLWTGSNGYLRGHSCYIRSSGCNRNPPHLAVLPRDAITTNVGLNRQPARHPALVSVHTKNRPKFWLLVSTPVPCLMARAATAGSLPDRTSRCSDECKVAKRQQAAENPVRRLQPCLLNLFTIRGGFGADIGLRVCCTCSAQLLLC
ncbi:hypothetical protein LMH87_010604 [Akanthomyces muscarius]|uniref:Uncharacterized protein n=1 Tax=Akanthomyces muscarius TaxID=2231603 RepID=A0A9W8QE35_AKAMU|nr:hypothetical protein LMH87_010604 [Akanthomyces muscarius]KAJ4154141.1 hypothetical protein LMH87_010604 [Akanthomyces muscarius]